MSANAKQRRRKQRADQEWDAHVQKVIENVQQELYNVPPEMRDRIVQNAQRANDQKRGFTGFVNYIRSLMSDYRYGMSMLGIGLLYLVNKKLIESDPLSEVAPPPFEATWTEAPAADAGTSVVDQAFAKAKAQEAREARTRVVYRGKQ